MRRLAPLAVLAALAAGCGGGHDARSPYAKRLDALCKDAGGRIAKVPRARTPSELVATKTQIDRIGGAFVRDLKALRPGLAERTQAAQIASLYDSYWTAQPALLRLLRTQQYDVFGRYEEDALRYAKQAEAIALQLGASECKKNPVR